uniref:Uncharacterized protein n=1 Tax=Strongyloides papillosus TaxID=174720 RepID=A0A0N5C7I9_STREA
MRFFNILTVFIIISISTIFPWSSRQQLTVTVRTICKCGERGENVEVSLRNEKVKEIYESRTKECDSIFSVLGRDLPLTRAAWDTYVNFTHLCHHKEKIIIKMYLRYCDILNRGPAPGETHSMYTCDEAKYVKMLNDGFEEN